MLKVPFRCTATTESQLSSSMLKIMRSRRIPALLTTMLSLPKVLMAVSTMFFAALKSATLSPLAMASPPFFLISATTSWAGVAVGAPVPSKCAPRSFTTTFAPSLAMSNASSLPMPRPAPVTIATLPSSSMRDASFGNRGETRSVCPSGGSVVKEERALGSRLEHQVERGLGGAPEAREARAQHHVTQPGLSGLRAQAEADLLSQRRGRTDERRRGIVDAPDRIQVVLDRVVRER